MSFSATIQHLKCPFTFFIKTFEISNVIEIRQISKTKCPNAWGVSPQENVDMLSFYVIWQEIAFCVLLEDITQKTDIIL